MVPGPDTPGPWDHSPGAGAEAAASEAKASGEGQAGSPLQPELGRGWKLVIAQGPLGHRNADHSVRTRKLLTRGHVLPEGNCRAAWWPWGKEKNSGAWNPGNHSGCGELNSLLTALNLLTWG